MKHYKLASQEDEWKEERKQGLVCIKVMAAIGFIALLLTCILYFPISNGIAEDPNEPNASKCTWDVSHECMRADPKFFFRIALNGPLTRDPTSSTCISFATPMTISDGS